MVRLVTSMTVSAVIAAAHCPARSKPAKTTR